MSAATPGVCKSEGPTGWIDSPAIAGQKRNICEEITHSCCVSLYICQLGLQVDSHKSLRARAVNPTRPNTAQLALPVRAERLVPPQDERDSIETGQCQRSQFELCQTPHAIHCTRS